MRFAIFAGFFFSHRQPLQGSHRGQFQIIQTVGDHLNILIAEFVSFIIKNVLDVIHTRQGHMQGRIRATAPEHRARIVSIFHTLDQDNGIAQIRAQGTVLMVHLQNRCVHQGNPQIHTTQRSRLIRYP